MKEQFGRYLLDISKLIFGGAVIAAIMRQNVNFLIMVAVGSSTAMLAALGGFYCLKPTKNK